MRESFKFFLIYILVGLHYSFAQSITANLEGWILDEQNRPVAGATVQVSSTDMQGVRGTATDEGGYFHIAAVPSGVYSVSIRHISFRHVVFKDVRLFLGQTTSLGQIHLEEHAITASELVISGNRPEINSRSAADDRVLTANEFHLLPIERNYFNIAELLPNANLSYKSDGGTNFAGATGEENRYFIDGSEVTEPEMGLLRYELPYNFVREVETRTGGYQAEYQSALGGIVNVITYSGSNDFHASVFGFFTNNDFSKAPRLSAGQPPSEDYANYDAGIGLGGPILKDRLWYYVAYDPEAASEDVYVNGLGSQKSRLTYQKFAGKLTWDVNESNLLTLSASGNPYSGREIVNNHPELNAMNPEVVNRDVTYLITNFSACGIHNIGDNLLLESSLSLNSTRANIAPISASGAQPSFLDYEEGTASGGLGFTGLNPSTQVVNASVKGTMTLSMHTIKAGLGYSRNSTTNDTRWKLIERDTTGYVVTDASTVGTVSSDNFWSFFQDSWQISQRLCLNAGVRWDPQWLIASDGTLAQKITDQVQPRIGLIYQPGEFGTQKITASYGRFYEPVLLSLSVYYHIKGGYWNITFYPNDPRLDTSGARFVPSVSAFVSNVPDVEGQYFDEFSLGYERQLPADIKAGVRGLYRRLGQGIEDGVVSEENQVKYGSLQVYGNPGSGLLSSLPTMEREYSAIEVSLQRFAPAGFNFLVSYVLSRNWGNYDGFAETYDITGGALLFPNNSNQFGIASRMINSEGLLPNDRTHVFKGFASYAFDFGLTAGTAFQWMSGTPLNEFGVDSIYEASTFLQPRGSVGRTPSIWDLSLRIAYNVSGLVHLGSSTRLIIDLLHIASRRTALDYDQKHYYDYDQKYPNPNYMVPIQFQPPMSMRLGMESDL